MPIDTRHANDPSDTGNTCPTCREMVNFWIDVRELPVPERMANKTVGLVVCDNTRCRAVVGIVDLPSR